MLVQAMMLSKVPLRIVYALTDKWFKLLSAVELTESCRHYIACSCCLHLPYLRISIENHHQRNNFNTDIKQHFNILTLYYAFINFSVL